MPYFPDLNSYLHHSSLLIQAYPTARISTRYSLPSSQKPNSKSKSNSSSTENAPDAAGEKRTPAATLTLKTFHPESGICLKYKTDKAAEVGRLVTGLGKLAKGEMIEMPTAAAASVGADKMDVDGAEEVAQPAAAPVKVEEVKTQPAAAAGGGGGGGAGKSKKKKGKK